MLWLMFAFGAAIMESIYYASIKKFLKGIKPFVLSSGVFLTAGTIMMIVSYFRGFPEFGNQIIYGVLGTGIVNVLGVSLYLFALKESELGLVIPMMSFTPAFTIITSYFILGELPGAYGIVGVLIMAMGIYIANITKDFKHVLDPIRHIWDEKGVLLMLIAAFLFSFSSVFDRMVVTNSDVYFAGGIVPLFIGTSMLIISIITKQAKIESYKQNYKFLLLIGCIFALNLFMHNSALQRQIVPFVMSVKRTSVLFSVLIGYHYFKEQNLGTKFIGAIVMFIGMLVILFL